MLVVMQRDATKQDIEGVCEAIRRMGYQPVPISRQRAPTIGILAVRRWPTISVQSSILYASSRSNALRPPARFCSS